MERRDKKEHANIWKQAGMIFLVWKGVLKSSGCTLVKEMMKLSSEPVQHHFTLSDMQAMAG